MPNCKAGHSIQFGGFVWVACVAELFWIMASDQYNGQYLKSHNRYVLLNWPLSFHTRSQIKATKCIICVLIIPENSFYFDLWCLTVPGRCSVNHILWLRGPEGTSLHCFFIAIHKFWLVWKNIKWLGIHDHLECIHAIYLFIHAR